MRKNKNKSQDIKLDKMQELYKILDRNYFHICITDNPKYRNNLEWSVYYKNLTPEDYYSEANKPLLTSDKNCIQDIYKLRDIFEKLKEQELIKNNRELFENSYMYHSRMYEIKQKSHLGMLNIFTSYAMFNVLLSLIVRNSLISILNGFFCIFIAIYLSFNINRTSKLLEKADKEIKELFLKNTIKRQGLTFVERIKEKWNV